jgi:hypothetical protein
MNKTNKTPSDVQGATTGDEDVRAKNARRADRARRIANMMKAGHPFAGPANQMNQLVTKQEDELSRTRSQLMAILRGVE